jgi:hypothetical protein
VACALVSEKKKVSLEITMRLIQILGLALLPAALGASTVDVKICTESL